MLCDYAHLTPVLRANVLCEGVTARATAGPFTSEYLTSIFNSPMLSASVDDDCATTASPCMCDGFFVNSAIHYMCCHI